MFLYSTGKIAAHSAYDMFSKYKYLIVGLFFSQLGFWNGNFFLIAPFPGHCLLLPFYTLAKSLNPRLTFSMQCIELLCWLHNNKDA